MTTDNEVKSLRIFQLKLENMPNDGLSVNVYANGRQQFEVTLVIEAINSQNQIIEVSATDMSRVELIDYSSEGSYSEQLSRSYSYSGYDKPGLATREGEITQQDEITPSAVSTLRFWESVKPGVTSRLHIAAKITLGGVTFYTNDPGAKPGGTEVKDGRSNSSFTVIPLRPESFRADYFEIRKKLGSMGYNWIYNDHSNMARYLELWELRFKDLNRKIYSSSLPEENPTPWFSQYTQGSKPYHCHWLLPVRRGWVGSVVRLGWNRQGHNRNDIDIGPYYDDGSAYAVIESSDYIETHAYNSWDVTYIDNNGNGHKIRITPNSNGREFVLRDA